MLWYLISGVPSVAASLSQISIFPASPTPKLTAFRLWQMNREFSSSFSTSCLIFLLYRDAQKG